MQKKVLTVISAVAGSLVILIAGFYLGVLTETEKVAPRLETLSKLQNLLQSKLVQTSEIFVSGEVTKISNGKITLTSIDKKESLEIPVSSTARIIAFVYPEKVETGKPFVPEQKEVKFGDIKVGDSINMNIKISANGQFEGTSIRILPQIIPPK